MSKKIDYNSYWQIDENPISRTGIFPYLGRQISPLLEPNKVYDVLRPEEELFSQETMNSFKLKPLVNDHCMLGEDFTPAEKHGIHGVLGERIGRKGDFLVANMEIYSETIKNEIRNGKKELSLGYFCDYDLTPGTYRGRHYDAVQRNLRGNHIALVDKGRMGHDVRVMDGMRVNDAKNVLVYDEMPFVEDGKSINNFPLEDIDHWITCNGSHIPVLKGDSTEVALWKFFEIQRREEAKRNKNQKRTIEPALEAKINQLPKDIAEGVKFALTSEIVAKISGTEFQKDGVPLTVKVPEFYQKAYGGKAKNPELGDVLLDVRGVKDDMAHGVGSVKGAAFMCVPEVIKKGFIYDRQKNWKGRGYDTFVIIAPVEIGGKKYIEEVIVKKGTERQGLYLHEVGLKKELENVFKTTNGGTSPASRLIIAEKITKSNSQQGNTQQTGNAGQSTSAAVSAQKISMNSMDGLFKEINEAFNDFNSGETEKAAAKEKGMKDEKESKNPPEAADPGEEKKARPEEESVEDKKSCDSGKSARIAEILKGKTDEQTIAAVMEALGQPDDTEEAGDGDEQKAEGKKEKEPESKDKKPEGKEEGKTAKKEASTEDAALSDSVFDRLEAEIASRIAARDALVSRLKPIIGEFKGEAMTKRQVIEYACDALSLTEKTEKALTACLDRKEAEGTAYVKGGGSNHSVIERFLKGE